MSSPGRQSADGWEHVTLGRRSIVTSSAVLIGVIINDDDPTLMIWFH